MITNRYKLTIDAETTSLLLYGQSGEWTIVLSTVKGCVTSFNNELLKVLINDANDHLHDKEAAERMVASTMGNEPKVKSPDKESPECGTLFKESQVYVAGMLWTNGALDFPACLDRAQRVLDILEKLGWTYTGQKGER